MNRGKEHIIAIAPMLPMAAYRGANGPPLCYSSAAFAVTERPREPTTTRRLVRARIHDASTVTISHGTRTKPIGNGVHNILFYCLHGQNLKIQPVHAKTWSSPHDYTRDKNSGIACARKQGAPHPKQAYSQNRVRRGQEHKIGPPTRPHRPRPSGKDST